MHNSSLLLTLLALLHYEHYFSCDADTQSSFSLATKRSRWVEKRELSCERNAMQGKKEKKNAFKVRRITAFPCLYHIFTRSVLFSPVCFFLFSSARSCNTISSASAAHSPSGSLDGKLMVNRSLRSRCRDCNFAMFDHWRRERVPGELYNNSITQITIYFSNISLFNVPIRIMLGCRNTLFLEIEKKFCLIFSSDAIRISTHPSVKSTVGV